MTASEAQLPAGWQLARIGEIADVNPSLDASINRTTANVSFVPMAAVEAQTGAIDLSRTKHLSEVRKGYRHFRERDVLFAKITPCMENGKMAVIPRLQYGIGLGSTEFHVLRPSRKVSSEYLFLFVSSAQFRSDAERHMTGAVGQRRVPAAYLVEHPIPLPPVQEQCRIAETVNRLFSELDMGIDILRNVLTRLSIYRQTLLKSAFEGKLTEQWRKENKDGFETPGQLLDRIKRERAVRYQQQVERWKETVATWERSGRIGRRPTRPRRLTSQSTHSKDKATDRSAVPDGWLQLSVESVGTVQLGRQRSPRNRSSNYATKYIRAANITASGLNLDDVLDMDFRPHELETYRLEKGDLVLSEASGSAAQVGKPAIWNDQIPDCCFQNTVIRHRSYCSDFAIFLLWLYRYYYLSGRFAKVAGGVGINHLSAAKFARITIPLCSLAEQQEIVRLLEERFAVIDQHERDIEAAMQQVNLLRQSILNRAFSGRLVAQDRSDEPASMLLERIRAEREQATTRSSSRKKRQRQAASQQDDR